MASITRTSIDPIDGLPAMHAGRWVTEEKHAIINRYIDISWGARKGFQKRSYTDLFSGTGRIYLKHNDSFADGGPLAAWRMAQSRRGAFTEFHVADANPDYLRACTARLSGASAPVTSAVGYAHETVDLIAPRLENSGLHLALLDPFNAGHLHFSIIERLSRIKRIDVVVHLSTGDIQRNIASGLRGDHQMLDQFAPEWKHAINLNSSKHTIRRQFIEHWTSLVNKTGFRVCDTMYPVKNSKNSTMYYLCMLAKHDMPERFWRDACKIPGQSTFSW